MTCWKVSTVEAAVVHAKLAFRLAVVALNVPEVLLMQTQGMVASPVADKLWFITKWPCATQDADNGPRIVTKTSMYPTSATAVPTGKANVQIVASAVVPFVPNLNRKLFA